MAGAHACTLCGTRSTPLWRRSADGSGRRLCNSCGLREAASLPPSSAPAPRAAAPSDEPPVPRFRSSPLAPPAANQHQHRLQHHPRPHTPRVVVPRLRSAPLPPPPAKPSAAVGSAGNSVSAKKTAGKKKCNEARRAPAVVEKGKNLASRVRPSGASASPNPAKRTAIGQSPAARGRNAPGNVNRTRNIRSDSSSGESSSDDSSSSSGESGSSDSSDSDGSDSSSSSADSRSGARKKRRRVPISATGGNGAGASRGAGPSILTPKQKQKQKLNPKQSEKQAQRLSGIARKKRPRVISSAKDPSAKAPPATTPPAKPTAVPVAIPPTVASPTGGRSPTAYRRWVLFLQDDDDPLVDPRAMPIVCPASERIGGEPGTTVDQALNVLAALAPRKRGPPGLELRKARLANTKKLRGLRAGVEEALENPRGAASKSRASAAKDRKKKATAARSPAKSNVPEPQDDHNAGDAPLSPSPPPPRRPTRGRARRGDPDSSDFMDDDDGDLDSSDSSSGSGRKRRFRHLDLASPPSSSQAPKRAKRVSEQSPPSGAGGKSLALYKPRKGRRNDVDHDASLDASGVELKLKLKKVRKGNGRAGKAAWKGQVAPSVYVSGRRARGGHRDARVRGAEEEEEYVDDHDDDYGGTDDVGNDDEEEDAGRRQLDFRGAGDVEEEVEDEGVNDLVGSTAEHRVRNAPGSRKGRSEPVRVSKRKGKGKRINSDGSGSGLPEDETRSERAARMQGRSMSSKSPPKVSTPQSSARRRDDPEASTRALKSIVAHKAASKAIARFAPRSGVKRTVGRPPGPLRIAREAADAALSAANAAESNGDVFALRPGPSSGAYNQGNSSETIAALCSELEAVRDRLDAEILKTGELEEMLELRGPAELGPTDGELDRLNSLLIDREQDVSGYEDKLRDRDDQLEVQQRHIASLILQLTETRSSLDAAKEATAAAVEASATLPVESPPDMGTSVPSAFRDTHNGDRSPTGRGLDREETAARCRENELAAQVVALEQELEDTKMNLAGTNEDAQRQEEWFKNSLKTNKDLLKKYYNVKDENIQLREQVSRMESSLSCLGDESDDRRCAPGGKGSAEQGTTGSDNSRSGLTESGLGGDRTRPESRSPQKGAARGPAIAC